jgi:hypothetical protein
MIDNLHVDPITLSNSSSNISSTDNSTNNSTKDSTSSLIIPAPSSKSVIIKIHSTNGKLLPISIDSDHPKSKWKKIPRNEAINKINKEKDDETTTNKSPSTSKTSVPTTSNNKDKIKRKRNSAPNTNLVQTNDPNVDYFEEFPENSSDEQYSDDDIDGKNNNHVDDTETNVTDASATKLNQQSTTATDVGAFASETATTSKPVNSNN